MLRRLSALAALVSLVASLLWLPIGAQENKGGPEIVAKLKGHTDSVYAVAYSPDGKYVVTASFDNTLKLWDAKTGKELKTYGGTGGHTKQVICVGFSEDGAMIASGATDNTLKVWDVPVNAPIRSLKTGDASLAVALSPDGKKLAIGGKDGALKLVNPDDFKELVKFEKGHEGAITGISFNGNGQQLATVGADRTLRYWNTTNGQLLATMGAHSAGVNGVVVNPNNTAAYTIGGDGFLKYWQVAPPPPAKTLAGHAAPIRAMALTPDNANVYTGGDDRSVHQFAIATSKETRALTGPQAAVVSVATHPSNTFIAGGTVDSRIFLWNNADGKLLTSWLAHAGPVTSMQMAPNGQQLMSAGGDGMVKFWAMPPIVPKTLTHPDAVLATVASPDGKKLFTGANDKLVRIFDTTKQAMEKQFAGHAGAVTAVAVSANLQVLASGSADKTVRVWNQGTGKEAAPPLAHHAPITALAINPAGNQMLSASEDGSVKLWKLPLVEPKASSLIWQKKHAGAVRAALFTPKGDQVITAGDDKTIKIWNAADGKDVKTLTNDGPVTHLSLNADGTKLAAAGADKNVKIWTLADGKASPPIAFASAIQSLALSPKADRIAVGVAEGPKHLVRVRDLALSKDVQVFEDHAAAVTALQYLADGRTLVTASADKTARLLDVGVVSALAAHPAGATFAQYHSNGTQLLTGGADKTVKLWDLQKGAVLKSFGPLADPIRAVAFSKDFTRVAAAAGKTVKAWTVADGKEIASLPHAADVLSVSFSQDGTRLATGAADKETRLWDIATSKELQFFAHADPVDAVLQLPNNVVISAAGKVGRIDTPTILKQTQVDPGAAHALALVPANTHVLTGGADKIVKLWNVGNGNKEREFTGATGAVKAIAMSKNSQLVAIGGADSVVRVHQFADGKEIGAVKLAGEARALGFTPNNAALVASSAGKTLNAWAVPFTANQPPAKDFLDPVQSFTSQDVLADFTIAADNASIYSAAQDKAMHVWKLASPTPIRNFAHPNIVDAVAFQPKGNLLASACNDGKIRFYDLAKNAVAKDITAHTSKQGNQTVPEPIYSLTFSADGKQLLSASFDNSLKLWGVPAGNLIREFKPYTVKTFEKGHQEPVFTASFSPDGKFIASGSSGLERVIKIWNAADGNVVRDLPNPDFKAAPNQPARSHPGDVWNVRFTKDSKYLVSVGDAPGNKGFIAVWDWQAGKMLSSDTLQLGVFYGLALAPDEKTLAVSAGNRDRKLASPDFNSAYVLKLPLLGK